MSVSAWVLKQFSGEPTDKPLFRLLLQEILFFADILVALLDFPVALLDFCPASFEIALVAVATKQAVGGLAVSPDENPTAAA